MRTKRTYKLRKVYIRNIGIRNKALVFDFWNSTEHTGYEAHVTIYHDIKKAFRIAYCYEGRTLTIVAWDELITCIKSDVIKEDTEE